MTKKATAMKPPPRSGGQGSPQSKLAKYRSRVEDLYKTAEAWANEWSPKATTRRVEVEVNELPIGVYTIDALDIELPGLKRPVRLRPAGCFVVGAEGKIDVESLAGRETLVFLADGEPAMTVQIASARGTARTGGARRETADGWVWVQNRLMGLFPTVNDDLMRRIVEVLGR